MASACLVGEYLSPVPWRVTVRARLGWSMTRPLLQGSTRGCLSSAFLWRLPNKGFPWIAWSYADIAMVEDGDELLACDVARRSCERASAEQPFLMPTN